ncbi:MAG TPA: DUF899 family protein [Solirubrobacteraceae bacterium]
MRTSENQEVGLSLPEIASHDAWVAARTELLAREKAFTRAPHAKIADYRRRQGWTFPWYSSHGSDFNYDFHVTLDESVAPVQYNFRTREGFAAAGQEVELAGEFPGRSCFLRDGDRVSHTYSVYARGLETIGGSYYLLEETALGRQEEWEQPAGRAASVRGANPDFAG